MPIDERLCSMIYKQVPKPKVLDKYGIQARNICNHYRQGKSLRKIAAMFKISHEWVRQILEANGVKLRPGQFNAPAAIGEERNQNGYVKVYVGEGFEGAPKNGWMYKHRLVMQNHLGRLLAPWELVHHIDRNRTNNDISNLKLVSEVEHATCIDCPYHNYYRQKTGLDRIPFS